MSSDLKESATQQNKKTVGRLFLLVVGMFGFGFFIMPPLYGLICDITGSTNILNGGTTGRITEADLFKSKVDKNRVITVQFDLTKNADLPWEIYPMVKTMELHPGEVKEIAYFAKNNSDKTIVAQAIPGVTPWQATEHFNKTECFCFQKQELKPGESKKMPLRFVIDHKLPNELKTITLSYTFMDTDRNKLKKTKNIPQLHSSL
ncbi:MAG: cytochrome c oxidase assembly protein [Gammaproteobacteria bacterium]|nr:cytochrome c oxidase assembly protein [Gammaproteobacteria bacterium]